MKSHVYAYVAEHALDKLSPEYLKGLKEALRKDIITILGKESKKVDKLVDLIWEKAKDRKSGIPSSFVILNVLRMLPALLKHIEKGDVVKARAVNMYCNAAFGTPYIVNDLIEIIYGK